MTISSERPTMTTGSADGVVSELYTLTGVSDTVEPLLKDPLAKGHCIKYLSTGDSTLVTKIQFLI